MTKNQYCDVTIVVYGECCNYKLLAAATTCIKDILEAVSQSHLQPKVVQTVPDT